MNKAYLKETPPSGMVCTMEWDRILFGTHLATKSPYFLVKMHKTPGVSFD